MKNSVLSFLFILTVITGCGSTTTTNNNQTFLENFNPYNEPYFPYQWYLSYTNNTFTKTIGVNPDASIHIFDAWKQTLGKNVLVAVIDNNFEITHKDLQRNIYDYYNVDYDSKNVSNDTDESSHGTATAGFIASVANGYGIVGTAPAAKLLLIQQFLDDDALTIKAFEYAKKMGAKIISNSWGTGHVSDAVAAELDYLKEQNITIFFASGNNGPTLNNDNQNLDYPGVYDESELPSVIGVGATNEFNELASYSNYGKNIDILAPGGELPPLGLGLLGLDDTGPAGSYYTSYTFYNGYTLYLDDAHAFNVGTSFSCPIAAGVGALMLSINPSLTPEDIRTILIQTADKIESDSVYYDENGFNLKRAYGKVNAAKAVEMAKNYATTSTP